MPLARATAQGHRAERAKIEVDRKAAVIPSSPSPLQAATDPPCRTQDAPTSGMRSKDQHRHCNLVLMGRRNGGSLAHRILDETTHQHTMYTKGRGSSPLPSALCREQGSVREVLLFRVALVSKLSSCFLAVSSRCTLPPALGTAQPQG